VRWEGAELIEALQAQGRRLPDATPGLLRVTAQAVAPPWRITVLYRPARKEWLRDWSPPPRSPNLDAAHHTQPASGRCCAPAGGRGSGLLPDQVPPLGMGVWAPFFVEAYHDAARQARPPDGRAAGVDLGRAPAAARATCCT
jgi:KDO2-lipid IV(A) lauroyltransferase